jgi:uncharacterized protein (DUF697 family)
MKALFGVVSLLVVVAILGFVAGHQLKALRRVPSASTGAAIAGPANAGSASARDSAQQVQQQVRDDLAKALDQAAQNNARAEEAAK